MRADGKLVKNEDPMYYLIPHFLSKRYDAMNMLTLDIPDRLEAIHLDTSIPDGPFGSSGASEAFQAAGHCAVINAIYNACGVRIHEIPALPEKIKAGLDAISEGGKPGAPKKYYLGTELYEELESIQADPLPYDGKDFFKSLDVTE